MRAVAPTTAAVHCYVWTQSCSVLDGIRSSNQVAFDLRAVVFAPIPVSCCFRRFIEDVSAEITLHSRHKIRQALYLKILVQ